MKWSLDKFIAGRPPGRPATTRRAFAQMMRDLCEEHLLILVNDVMRSRNTMAKLYLARFLAEYGYGKPLDPHVHMQIGAGIDPNSPEGILLSLANQHIPRPLGEDDQEDEDPDA